MFCTTLLSLTLVLPLASDRTPQEILKEIRAKGNAVPVAVLEELAGQGTAEALEALIKGIGAISKTEKLCAAYRVIGQFEGDAEALEDAVEFLAECADEKQERLALHAVWQLGSLWPDSQAALVKLALEHATADGRSFAVMHLVENGMPLSGKQLDRLARAKDDETRYEGLLARANRIEDVVKRARELDKRKRSKDAIDRLVAVELLATEDVPGRFEFLGQSLSDGDARVARKASAALERTRQREAVALLIARLGEARSGERFRLSQALERLTGKSLGREPGRWQRWWKAEGAEFKVPAAPDERPPAAPNERPPVVQGDGMTTSFYGMPILADRLVFAIDASDSMKAPASDDGGPSRMEIAKAELIRAIEGLGEASQFDIVHFGKSAWSWKGELVPAKSTNQKTAIKHVQQIKLSWGTEIYRALREAFRSPQADTILFMTDGDPQLSLMQDRAALQRIVTQWNRTRHTTLDCITIGTDRKWLRELAEQSGGRYKRIE